MVLSLRPPTLIHGNIRIKADVHEITELAGHVHGDVNFSFETTERISIKFCFNMFTDISPVPGETDVSPGFTSKKNDC